MTDLDLALRGLLTVEAFVALFISASFFGTIWPERGRPTRVVIVGLGVILVYVFVGQFKAYRLHIPFDLFSMIGLVGYTVLLVGGSWFIHERRNRSGR